MAVGDGKQLGYNSLIGVAEETTFGTKVDPSAFIEFNSESFKRNIEEIKIESINTGRDFTKRLLGNESVEGSLECHLNVAENAQVYIMKQAMGGTVASVMVTSTAGTITGSYIHTLNAGNMENNKSSAGATDTVGLTFQIQKGGNHVWDYVGCRVNTLSIKGEIGSPIVMSAEIIGKTASITSSTPTAVFADANPVNFIGVTITTGDSITNTGAESFIGFEFTLNNNLVADSNARELGSRTVKVLPPTRREVMLKLTQRFDTTTAYQRFIQATATAIQIKLDSFQTMTAATTTAAGEVTTYSMLIKLPKCYFNSNMPEVGEVGILTHEIEVSALKDNTTTGYSVQMVVYNGTANY